MAVLFTTIPLILRKNYIYRLLLLYKTFLNRLENCLVFKTVSLNTNHQDMTPVITVVIDACRQNMSELDPFCQRSLGIFANQMKEK